jgi:hypothetical protein
MKALIYIGCFFLESLAIVLIKYATGFDFLRSGAIPAMFIVGCTLWVSAHLCKKWDEHTARKMNDTSKSTAEMPETERYANKLVSVYKDFLKKNKFSYLTKNKYCKYDGLLLLAFFTRNTLVEETNKNVEEFTTEYFDYTINLASSWLSIGKKEARDMFYNRVSLYNKIFCDPNRTYQEKMESCAWELAQLVKYDISYGSYQEYSAPSPLMIMGIFEETRIQAEVFELIKGVAEKL